MALPCVLATGTSHIVSMRNAQAARIAKGAAMFDLVDLELFPKFDPPLRPVEGRLVLNEAIEPALRDLVMQHQPQLLVGSLWGNQHFFMSTANLPRRLDFVLPEQPELALDPLGEIVPYDALHAFIRHYFTLSERVAAALKPLSGAPLLLVPAPAPVRDFAAIPRGSSNRDIDALVAKHGATPALVRYKFWRLAATIQEELAASFAAVALPVPEGTVDEDGLRRPEFHSTDWIHANTAYGELVLRQIDARLNPV